MSGTSVTVPGSGGSSIKETFSSTQNFILANQIADALAQASKGAGLIKTSAVQGDPVPPPPLNTVPGGINELIVNFGGDYTIPAGTQDHPDYVVVLNNAQDVTIHGAANTTIWGGGPGKVTIVDPALITISEEAGNATATLTGAGDVIAGNSLNDTITAAGSTETVFAGDGNNSLSASGDDDLIVGGTGFNTFSVSGGSDTVDAQLGKAAATLSGSSDVFLGGLGGFSVLDMGSGDFIRTGIGSGTVTTSGSNASITGGTGTLSVTGRRHQ